MTEGPEKKLFSGTTKISVNADSRPGKGVHASQQNVDIWCVALTPEHAAAVEPLLSEEERARAFRFWQWEQSTSFIAARGALRGILADYLATKPGEIVIDQAPGCKPQLGGPYALTDLSFSLSKSGDRAVVAVSHGSGIGIDMEIWHPVLFDSAVADEILSAAEMILYRHLPPSHQPQFLCRTFTRKEAVLKACGEGLAVSMPEMVMDKMAMDQTTMACLIEDILLSGRGQAGQFFIRDVQIGPGIFCALATSEQVAIVRFRHWPEVDSQIVAPARKSG